MTFIRLELIGWGLLNAFGLLAGQAFVFGQKIHGEPPCPPVAWFFVAIFIVVPGLILMARASRFARFISPESRYLLCCMAGANVLLIPFFVGARQIIWAWTHINPW
jgi:hypothetical protein